MNKDQRVFLKLIISMVAVLTLMAIIVVYFGSTLTLSNIKRGTDLLGLLLFGLAFVLFLVGIASAKLTKYGKTSSISYGLLKTSNMVLFPIMLSISRVFGIDRDIIRRVFTRINNVLVTAKNIKVENHEILVLLPHCLQEAQCQYRITNDIYNCKMCGKCVVGDIIKISDRYGVKTVVATGGTLAREWIKRYRPKAIIAVACERDLASGISDVKVLPVLGVSNERPHGPCYNTTVSLKDLEQAIRFFMKEA